METVIGNMQSYLMDAVYTCLLTQIEVEEPDLIIVSKNLFWCICNKDHRYRNRYIRNGAAFNSTFLFVVDILEVEVSFIFAGA